MCIRRTLVDRPISKSCPANWKEKQIFILKSIDEIKCKAVLKSICEMKRKVDLKSTVEMKRRPMFLFLFFNRTKFCHESGQMQSMFK